MPDKKSKVANLILPNGNKFELPIHSGTIGPDVIEIKKLSPGHAKILVGLSNAEFVAKKIIDKNKQALVLLPEIFLTNEFKSRFEDFFGFEPAIWHSKITPKNKRIIWKGIIENKIRLIVGARSALLLPFKKLGLIIVDEEHDASYKQVEGVIYNARDMAISRASFEKIPIHLVTSIPSIETYNNIHKKKYRPEIRHQSGKANLQETQQIYKDLDLKARVESFISDMAEAYGWADLVVCRAGALTISELAAAGVGALLIPYPYAADDHQFHNGKWLVSLGAAYMVKEQDLTDKLLVSILNEWLGNPVKLDSMAMNAKKSARLGVAELVADICMGPL